jgi:murein DD-endopeptidase MepM/ murein hydrolase activator NlpD
MKKLNLQGWLGSLLSSILIFPVITPITSAQEQSQTCQASSVWSRMTEYTIQNGDTIQAIATNYNLIPETLIRVNPSLNSSRLPTGQTIKIPPFNGMIIQAPSGATWRDLGAMYGIRADVLFELNGCQTHPQSAFIPGVSWTQQPTPSQANNYTGFALTPLLKPTNIGLNYGWQTQETTQGNFFHTGIDLEANLGDSVVTVADGIVVFTGMQDNYGNLIIINHEGGKQTRYAHLATINVQMGQNINAGNIIGTVGNTGIPDIKQTHLHFEVRLSTPLGWVAQDPLLHLKLPRLR